MISSLCNNIFQRSVEDYHVKDDIDAPEKNPYPKDTLENLLYTKNWIDTVQWHLEDIIRATSIDPVLALEIKRRIDRSNQDRTDMVEKIDDHFLQKFAEVILQPDCTINTESPAWAIDRLSILILKIYHMKEQVGRNDVNQEHRDLCAAKLTILLEQQKDLSISIDELLAEIESGKKKMKVYRQMKMYNDPSLNPVLYGTKN